MDDPHNLLEDSEEIALLLFELYGANAHAVASDIVTRLPDKAYARHILMTLERMEREIKRRPE